MAQDRCPMKVGTDGVLLGAWASVAGVGQALDIGSGTGVIALMLAQRQPAARVVGLEVDEVAARQAAGNALDSPFRERVTILPQSVQDYALEAPAGTFDLIVSNPPFFTGGVMSENQGRASVRHTVKLSHQDLLRSVQRLLSPQGRFSVVLPLLEGMRFEELAATYHLYVTRHCAVTPRPGKPVHRLLLEMSYTKPVAVERNTFAIHAEETGDVRSEAYVNLTRDFYLAY